MKSDKGLHFLEQALAWLRRPPPLRGQACMAVYPVPTRMRVIMAVEGRMGMRSGWAVTQSIGKHAYQRPYMRYGKIGRRCL